MSTTVDRTGHAYGRLTVVSRQGIDSHGKAQWNCACECGEVRVVRGSNLGNGRSRSCGCSKFKLSSGGVTKAYSQRSRELGGGDTLVRDRIARGWTKEEAVTTPIGNKRNTT